LGLKGEELFAIRGTPPSLFEEVKGDAFAPRSNYSMKIDFEKEPPIFKVSESHWAKTWLLDPRAPKVEPPAVIKTLHQRMLDMTKKGGVYGER
ncbi:MAG: ABC transporter ATP-binding protein, partial [Erysipelotrichaceae bacterium]|nr:ABC transporter ATP-binding protein [Erysipelotrichaceae bacterium]